MDERYDVVVIGGGPAGTTCATRLAQRGRKVLILERVKFPRFHIGESITAFGFTVFKDLGVYDELKAINHVKKKGLEFVMHEKTRKIYFLRDQANEPGERPWAFQMARHKLDQILLENARRKGVTVKEEHLVKQVLFEGDRAVGVEYKDLTSSDPDQLHRVYGKWIIDASGQGAVLNHQLKDNWYPDPLLENKMAVFCHWKGDIEVSNTDDDLNFKLCVHRNRRDWAWYIPIDKDTLSLGVVLSQQTVKEESQTKDLSGIFYSYARDIPYISDILKNPTLKTVEKFRCVKDYSYRSKRYYGNGWTICGDSAGFIDPVFSTGLQVAFNSAYALIDPLEAILDQDKPDLARLEAYDQALNRYYRVNSMLVYLFYMSKLDHEYFHSGSYLWKNIQWAGLKDRLAFLWHGLRYIRADKDTRLHWGIQVLFGNPAQDNVVADLYMALSRNYDKVFRNKTSDIRHGSTILVEA
ncbi:MAG TPA: NAD(P)/FAD-dependent oxidoreductase [Fimbriimonadaceae bacterium]|nr:NAD(P)/FAD-dependent oxidoreductase [Fimbriimonadaceae bacterium]